MTKKSSFAQGLEHMTKSGINPFSPQGAQVYKQMKQASGMPLSEMMSYVGKKSKSNVEQQRIENRLEKLDQ